MTRISVLHGGDYYCSLLGLDNNMLRWALSNGFKKRVLAEQLQNILLSVFFPFPPLEQTLLWSEQKSSRPRILKKTVQVTWPGKSRVLSVVLLALYSPTSHLNRIDMTLFYSPVPILTLIKLIYSICKVLDKEPWLKLVQWFDSGVVTVNTVNTWAETWFEVKSFLFTVNSTFHAQWRAWILTNRVD